MESLAEFADVISDTVNTSDPSSVAPELAIPRVDVVQPPSSQTVTEPTPAATVPGNQGPANLATSAQVPARMPVPTRRVTYPSSPGNNRNLATIGEEHARICAASGIPNPLNAIETDTCVDNFEFDEAEFQRRKDNPNEFYFDSPFEAAADTDNDSPFEAAADTDNDDDVEGYTTETSELVLDDESSGDFDNSSDFEGISEQLSKVSVAENQGEKRKRADSDLPSRYPKRSNRKKHE